MNRYDLEGRVAIVTGAARGIGFAVAERLTASGASVAVWDVDGAEAGKAAASLKNAHPVAVDVSDAGSIADAVKALAKPTSRFEPNVKTHELYAERVELYAKLYPSLKEVSHGLGKLKSA